MLCLFVQLCCVYLYSCVVFICTVVLCLFVQLCCVYLYSCVVFICTVEELICVLMCFLSVGPSSPQKSASNSEFVTVNVPSKVSTNAKGERWALIRFNLSFNNNYHALSWLVMINEHKEYSLKPPPRGRLPLVGSTGLGRVFIVLLRR